MQLADWLIADAYFVTRVLIGRSDISVFDAV